MKKFLSLLLALSTVFVFVACKDENQTVSNIDTIQQNTESKKIFSSSSSNETTVSNNNEKTSSEMQISNTDSSKSNTTTAQTSSPNSSSVKSNVTDKPTHTHSFSQATCTTPATCSCGATQGTPTGHNWTAATYTSPKKCSICGTTEGSPLEVPGSENYHGHVYTGGEYSEKFHYEANCAGKKSHEITWEEVERRHLAPCGTCVLK